MQAPNYLTKETDQSGKFKTLYPFKGEKRTYTIWAYDVRTYLKDLRVDHYFFIIDDGECSDVDNDNRSVKAKKTVNHAAMHVYLNSIIQGEAKSHIMKNYFL